MWIYLIVILAFGSLLSVAIVMASKNGSKAAQLESIKAELRKIANEQEKANRIKNNVASLSTDDARRMLQDVANKQSKRMQ